MPRMIRYMRICWEIEYMSTDYSDEMCRYELVDRDRKSRERS
jgi:hypothetical protein